MSENSENSNLGLIMGMTLGAILGGTIIALTTPVTGNRLRLLLRQIAYEWWMKLAPVASELRIKIADPAQDLTSKDRELRGSAQITK